MILARTICYYANEIAILTKSFLFGEEANSPY